MAPIIKRHKKTTELILEMQKRCSKAWYLYTPKDTFVHILIFNTFNVDSLKDKERIKAWCYRYDLSDPLMLMDTSEEVFKDLEIL